VDLASTTLGRLLFFASPLYKSVITVRCRRYNTRYGSLTTAAKGLLASSEVEVIRVSWPSAPTARMQSANQINDLSDWSIFTLTHFLLGQRILLVALWAALYRKWAYLIWDERAASTHIQTLVRQFSKRLCIASVPETALLRIDMFHFGELDSQQTNPTKYVLNRYTCRCSVNCKTPVSHPRTRSYHHNWQLQGNKWNLKSDKVTLLTTSDTILPRMHQRGAIVSKSTTAMARLQKKTTITAVLPVTS
jgi:hypothetical protein